MGDTDGKATGILQIVRLKQLLQKWQYKTLGSKDESSQDGVDTGIGEDGGGILTAVREKLMAVRVSYESDEDSSHGPEPPSDVPKGCVPVYVGPEQRRFIIPTTYLSSPVFRLLLEKAEEEFGFDHKGALTLPCEIEVFKYILQVMDQHQKGSVDDGGNP